MDPVRSTRRLVLLLLLAVAAVCSIGIIWLRSKNSFPRNVALILIDTLRADHLGVYGYKQETSPFFDRLASKGILFENAVSAAPMTFPSVNSLFTSRSPTVFYETTGRDLGIPPEMSTLAEVFRDHGFRTAAVSASPVVRHSPSRWNEQGGFSQGFERFDEHCARGGKRVESHTTACVTDQALEILSSFGRERFFLYVHYLDPHDPYQPPADWNRFAEDYRGKDFISRGSTNPIKQWLYQGGDDPQLNEGDVQHLRDLYNGEIRAVDASLQRLLDGFAEQEQLRETLFVFLSDHGESFMEHNHIQHGHNMYQTDLHIPLLFYWPQRWPAGERRSDLVCTVDVMPTILTLAGLPTPEGARGVPLLGPEAASHHATRSCFSEGRPNWRARRGRYVSLRMGTEKIIYDREQDAYELYDLAADPDELENLAPAGGKAGSPRFRALKEALQLWTRLYRQKPTSGGPAALDPDAERALRELGYIE